jgi:predicted O-linked N-acetylglucosamine transferase (SPINDLY family)
VHQECGRFDQAEACYRKALALNPDAAEIHNNLGTVFKEFDRFDDAEACYRKALALKPDYPEAYYNLGKVLKERGRLVEAQAGFKKALELDPDYSEARWMLAASKIPIVRELNDDFRSGREEFSRELSELEAWFDTNQLRAGHKCVGLAWPFYLAYQEENNSDLLNRHGALCARLMEGWKTGEGAIHSKADITGTVRVGIVCAYIHNHSVWNAIVKGWLLHLDRQQFELHVFNVGANMDGETDWAQSRANYFAQGPKSPGQWVEIILGKQLDVLIYPEIGMNPLTIKLASLRLAPVQVAAWGHPETTGLPTMDFYLSAEDFEPPDAQQNYSEQLVSLPHLGCCYQPAPVTVVEPDFKCLGLDAEAPILICPGTPFKYDPQYDRVLIEIVRNIRRCQLVFFFFNGAPEMSEKLHRRLVAVFEKSGLDFNEYAAFVAWQPLPVFYGLLQRAAVYLDTIGFSGFNTAMHAIDCNLPIVTREGRFMRGRLASGILRRLGLPELVARTEEDYIALASRLVLDAGYRHGIRERIKSNRHVLYGDLAPIRAFEEFLKEL